MGNQRFNDGGGELRKLNELIKIEMITKKLKDIKKALLEVRLSFNKVVTNPARFTTDLTIFPHILNNSKCLIRHRSKCLIPHHLKSIILCPKDTITHIQ